VHKFGRLGAHLVFQGVGEQHPSRTLTDVWAVFGRIPERSVELDTISAHPPSFLPGIKIGADGGPLVQPKKTGRACRRGGHGVTPASVTDVRVHAWFSAIVTPRQLTREDEDLVLNAIRDADAFLSAGRLPARPGKACQFLQLCGSLSQ
jgi:hypothetical protein